MNGFSILLCVVAAIAVESATDYCSSTICTAGTKHIACGHSGNFNSACPSDAKMVTFTSAMKQHIVDAHNENRNFIAGGNDVHHISACRMATMQWNEELASLAALNVRQCKMAHDECHNTDTFKYSGQNLAWIPVSGTIDHKVTLKRSVQMWYDEVPNVSSGPGIGNFTVMMTGGRAAYLNTLPNVSSGRGLGHFSVMLAERNIRVGCAAATYTSNNASNKDYLVACNYASTNIINFPIYSSCSKPGTSCTTGTNPTYPNLCSTSEVYNVNKWF